MLYWVAVFCAFETSFRWFNVYVVVVVPYENLQQRAQAAAGLGLGNSTCRNLRAAMPGRE